MLPSRYFIELTQPEIAAQLKANPLVILPAGSVEQHGPHLPTGTDTFAANVISAAVAERMDGLVLPATPFGVTPMHMPFEGTITFTPDTYMRVVTETCVSTAKHGAERLLVTKDAATRTASPIHTRAHPAPGAPWIATVSRSHCDQRTDAFIAGRPGAVRQVLGSAVKFCRVAEGGADIYPRLSPTSEWDIAAGHAVVCAAGGKITDGKGRPLRFGEAREGFLVPEFIAWGDPAAADQ